MCKLKTKVEEKKETFNCRVICIYVYVILIKHKKACHGELAFNKYKLYLFEMKAFKNKIYFLWKIIRKIASLTGKYTST